MKQTKSGSKSINLIYFLYKIEKGCKFFDLFSQCPLRPLKNQLPHETPLM